MDIALLSNFGEYAFGVILVLVLWQIVVKPQIQINTANTAALSVQADTLKETARTLLEVSETNKETALELRHVITEMQSWRNEWKALLLETVHGPRRKEEEHKTY